MCQLFLGRFDLFGRIANLHEIRHSHAPDPMGMIPKLQEFMERAARAEAEQVRHSKQLVLASFFS
jgi:hypothetical protein